jgi:hypothetical protein
MPSWTKASKTAAAEIFYNLKHNGYGDVLGDLAYGSKHLHIPLQAADLIAYEVGRYAANPDAELRLSTSALRKRMNLAIAVPTGTSMHSRAARRGRSTARCRRGPHDRQSARCLGIRPHGESWPNRFEMRSLVFWDIRISRRSRSKAPAAACSGRARRARFAIRRSSPCTSVASLKCSGFRPWRSTSGLRFSYRALRVS